MITYLDGSCFVRVVTRDGPVLAGWGRWRLAYASRLAWTEVMRTFYRLHLTGVWSEAELNAAILLFERAAASVVWLPISGRVLSLAGSRLPAHVRTLDAIHLATAQIARDVSAPGLVFATHDRQLAAAATALGFAVEGV